jgi:transcriptional regulator with XRE-family HTH domain
MYVAMNPSRVRELREEKGMSKRDLATAAGISLTTAKRVERGLPVRFPTGRKVLAVFGEKPSLELGRPVPRRPA